MPLCTRSCEFFALVDDCMTADFGSADVEQETNGLYSFDRKEKLDASRVKALMDDALAIFYQRVGDKV